MLTPLPPDARRRLAREHAAEEVEPRGVERGAEKRRCRRHVSSHEPVPPRAQRHARDERRERPEERRPREDDRRRTVETLRPRPRVPVEPGHRRAELAQREAAVRRIARLVPLRVRDRRFELEHVARAVGRRFARRQLEDSPEIRFILRADRRHRRIPARVVRAVGQQRAAGDDADDGGAGMERIRARRSRKRPADADRRQAARFGGEIRRRLDRVDARQFRLERRRSQPFDRLLAGGAEIHVGDLLRRRSDRQRFPRGHVLDDGFQIGFGFVREFRERPVGHAIGWNLDALQPDAVDVAEEMSANGPIDQTGDVEPGRGCAARRAASSSAVTTTRFRLKAEATGARKITAPSGCRAVCAPPRPT